MMLATGHRPQLLWSHISLANTRSFSKSLTGLFDVNSNKFIDDQHNHLVCVSQNAAIASRALRLRSSSASVALCPLMFIADWSLQSLAFLFRMNVFFPLAVVFREDEKICLGSQPSVKKISFVANDAFLTIVFRRTLKEITFRSE